MTIPVINLTDGYKVDHRRQYPQGTSLVYTNGTFRKSRNYEVKKVVYFGMQYFIKKYLIEEFNIFFNLPEDIAVKSYARRINNYLGEGHQVTFDHIKALHKLGYLPIRVKSLPEGAKVPFKVACFTIVNTMPEFFWLVNYLETLCSATIWGPCTSATSANEFRKIFNRWALDTVGNTDFVPFQGHDFSFRGMFGVEAALISGMAHLTSFVGTDTIPAIDGLEQYYGADSDKELIGCSVAATEHSVMCLGTGLYIWDKYKGDWTYQGEAEFELFKHLITVVYPKGIVSIVSDTWNLWRVLTVYLPALKKEILARDGKVVIRPDSGDPVKILTGYWWASSDAMTLFSAGNGGLEVYQENSGDYVRIEAIGHAGFSPGRKIDEYEVKGVIELLWEIFGGTTTEKGYRLLDSHVGAIYGDSINTDRAEQICDRLAKKGYASINWVAGIGSFTYQYVTRDTYGFAMKATYGEVDIEEYEPGEDHPTKKHYDIDIYKSPITDDGTKKSARGLLQVEEHLKHDSLGKIIHSTYIMHDMQSWSQEEKGALKTVFEDGKLIKEWTLQEIRSLIKRSE